MSSHIQVELDAINAAIDAAAVAGVSDDLVIAGLNRLWLHCYRAKVSEVSDTVLRAKFKGQDLGAVLAEFGFVERCEGGWKVKGTGRYTTIQEARSKGGKAASGNLKRGTKPGKNSRLQPGNSRKPAGGLAGTQPEVSPGSTPALDPKSEIRDVKAKECAASPDGEPPPESALDESEYRLLVTTLGTLFEKHRSGAQYRWQPKDFAGLKALRKVAKYSEISQRWARGLKHQGYPQIQSVAELNQHWNHFATDSPGPGKRGPGADWRTDWSGPEQVDATGQQEI